MKLRIEDHPDFPHRPEAQAKHERWLAKFLDRPERGVQAERLREFIERVHIFAFLERLIQGDVLFALPVHPKLIREPLTTTIDLQGEELARRELEQFAFADYPAAELANALEEMGIKVLHTRPPKAGELCGAFFFEGELGPAMLIGAEPESPEASFVLAHELAHLVIDVNPYQARYCRWRAGTLKNHGDRPEEARADRFARALLVPPELLGQRLRELQTDLRLDVLATLFGVPEGLIVERLIELGRPPSNPAAKGKAPGSEAKSGRATDAPPGISGDHLLLPSRYVNLASAAWAKRVLEHPALARFLGVPETEARALLEWLGVTQDPPPEELLH